MNIYEGVTTRTSTLASRTAYEWLRDRIVKLDLVPGTPLDEEALSRQTRVGLTPVRDAIKRLALEHLIVVYPRRGTFVSEINLGDERLLTEIRIEIEGLAAALAASRASKNERDAIVHAAKSIETEFQSEQLNALDAEFHRLIYTATHNPYLETSLHEYYNLSLRLWYYCKDRLPEIISESDSHSEIASAIYARDAAAARNHMVAHLMQSSADLRAVM